MDGTVPVVRRPAAVLALVAATASLSSGCERDTVTLSFQPTEGSQLEYETTVESVTVTQLPGRVAVTREDRTRLDAHQEVLDVGDDGVLVEVSLSRPGIGTRTFTMRFDRAAQLTRVERVEGIPAAALGDLGLSEIFPAAAGAPPDRPLAPGDRWAIDDEVQLAGDDQPARLRGEGRLVEVGVEDGEDVATVRSTASLPIHTTTSTTRGTQSLTGTQVTVATATYDLDGGALRRASAVTTATFLLVLGPPEGRGGDAIEGTLSVHIRSEVRRTG